MKDFFCLLNSLAFYIVIFPVCSETILLEFKSVLDSVNSVVEDVSYGLKSISAGVQYVDDFMKSAVSEDCHFNCPTDKKFIARSRYKPIPGGCGAYGIKLAVKSTPQKEFTECCNTHDICYGTCFSIKDKCDEKFQKCLMRACGKQAKNGNNQNHAVDCTTIAKIFHVGTQALGCKAFKDAQAEACWCIEKEL